MLSIHSIVLDIMYPPQGRGCSCRLQLPTMNQGKLITVSINLNKRITSKDKSQNCGGWSHRRAPNSCATSSCHDQLNEYVHFYP